MSRLSVVFEFKHTYVSFLKLKKNILTSRHEHCGENAFVPQANSLVPDDCKTLI